MHITKQPGAAGPPQEVVKAFPTSMQFHCNCQQKRLHEVPIVAKEPTYRQARKEETPLRKAMEKDL